MRAAVALALLLTGIGPGLLFILTSPERRGYGSVWGPLDQLSIYLGVGWLLFIGVPHVLVAVGVLRRRTWGLALATVIGLLWLAVGMRVAIELI